MTTFRGPSDILITSWLFTARWRTWPGNHLVPCVAELVGFCIPIHAHRCLPDPECLLYPSGLSLWLSVHHFCLVPVDDMVLFHGMVCDGWLVSYTVMLLCYCWPWYEQHLTCQVPQRSATNCHGISHCLESGHPESINTVIFWNSLTQPSFTICFAVGYCLWCHP